MACSRTSALNRWVIDCEVSVHCEGNKARFNKAKVGIAFDRPSETFQLVVVRANSSDCFILHPKHVTIFPSALKFQSKYVMLDKIKPERWRSLVYLIKKILSNQCPPRLLAELPRVRDIRQLKICATSLTVLSSAKNELARLTRCTTQELSQLSTLELCSQRSVSDHLWRKCTNLTTLKLIDCNLKCIPRELLAMRHTLIWLTLSHNQLAQLPTWFWKMNQLQTLDLSHNQLKRLPYESRFLTKCTALDFSHNQLRILPDWFCFALLNGDAPCYEKLNLSYNQLSHFYVNWNNTRLQIPIKAFKGNGDFTCNSFHLPRQQQRLDYSLKLNRLVENSKHKIPFLYLLALLQVIRHETLRQQLFEDSQIPRPIYDMLQDNLFVCSICNKQSLQWGSYEIVRRNLRNLFPCTMMLDSSGSFPCYYEVDTIRLQCRHCVIK